MLCNYFSYLYTQLIIGEENKARGYGKYVQFSINYGFCNCKIACSYKKRALATALKLRPPARINFSRCFSTNEKEKLSPFAIWHFIERRCIFCQFFYPHFYLKSIDGHNLARTLNEKNLFSLTRCTFKILHMFRRRRRRKLRKRNQNSRWVRRKTKQEDFQHIF